MKNLFSQLHSVLHMRRTRGISVPIIAVIILMFCGSAWQIFWPTTDPARYQCYALTFWLGSSATHLLPAQQCSFLQILSPQPAFHMLPLEYPPLTLLPFSLPLVVPVPYYQFAFMFMMSLVILLTYWLLQRFGTRGAALAFAFYLLIGAYALAQMRYDLLPALFTLLTLIAAERRRWTLAYVMLAVGVLLKLYPLLFLPSLFIAEQQSSRCFHHPPHNLSLQEIPSQILMTLRGASQWHWSNCLLFVGSILTVSGIFALFNFDNAVLSQLSYFAQRPIQIESVSSTLLWVGHSLGMPWWISYTFGSINIVSALNPLISPLTTCAFFFAVCYVLWLQWHQQLPLAHAMIALLLVFISTGKVFSPQYLIWLIPLLAYTHTFDSFWICLWSMLSLLTTVVYLFFYSQITNSEHIVVPPGFFETVALRNILFVVLTLSYLFNWFQARQKPVETALFAPARRRPARLLQEHT